MEHLRLHVALCVQPRVNIGEIFLILLRRYFDRQQIALHRRSDAYNARFRLIGDLLPRGGAQKTPALGELAGWRFLVGEALLRDACRDGVDLDQKVWFSQAFHDQKCSCRILSALEECATLSTRTRQIVNIS